MGDVPATLLPLDPGVPIPLPVPVTPTATLRTDAEKSKRDTRRDLPRGEKIIKPGIVII